MGVWLPPHHADRVDGSAVKTGNRLIPPKNSLGRAPANSPPLAGRPQPQGENLLTRLLGGAKTLGQAINEPGIYQVGGALGNANNFA